MKYLENVSRERHSFPGYLSKTSQPKFIRKNTCVKWIQVFLFIEDSSRVRNRAVLSN